MYKKLLKNKAMNRLIIFFTFLLGFFPSLFAQTGGIVLASYYDTVYMKSLNGGKVQLPESFLEEIKCFNILSYEQAVPFSKKISLKSDILFYCNDHPAGFAAYLQNNAAHLFSNVEFELFQEMILDYNPIDYYWDKKKVVAPGTPLYTVYYLWHLRKIEADKAWDITKSSPNIKIAVIDVGFDAGGYYGMFDFGHPDLSLKINKYDPLSGVLLADYCHPYAQYHGTMVATTAAGSTDKGGYSSSVGFNCGLIAYQVSNFTSFHMAHRALHAAHGGASVINISLSSSNPSHTNT